MNADRVITATYDWISLRKAFLYLIFFWIALPVLVFIPQFVEREIIFSGSARTLVYALYTIIYLAVIAGMVALTQHCLSQKRLPVQPFSVQRFVDTILAALLELWHIFVWNLHRAYRTTQLVLIIGIALLCYYVLTSPTRFTYWLLLFFVAAYIVVTLYNAVRLCFTVIIFYHKSISIKEAVREAWALTHQRFWHVLASLVVALGALTILFSVIAIIFGALAYVMFSQFFTTALAYKLATQIGGLFALAPALVGYYFAVIELYTQLVRERLSGHIIKRELARRALAGPKRSFAKKRAARKAKAKKRKGRR